MTGKELEAIGNKLSEKTGLMVVFWYTAPYIEGRTEDELKEEDKTYFVVVKDKISPLESKVYFRNFSDDWEELYETTKQALELFKYEID